MKVIFLDIDGVMNTGAYRESTQVDYFDCPVSEMHMPYLEYLVKATDAKIVLSSTWREEWDKGVVQFYPFGAYINRLFGKYGLEIFDKTPELIERDDEINEWKKLYQDELEAFVIIDDFDFEWSEENEKCLVRTTDDSGLDEIAVEKAIRILEGTERG